MTEWSFSSRSEGRLNTCHPILKQVFRRVVRIHDCTIIEGHRSEEVQTSMLAGGKSQLPWPKSNHNSFPSLAVDVAPMINGEINWKDWSTWCRFAGVVDAVSWDLNWKLKWGGDWESFRDGPHWELAEVPTGWIQEA